MSCVVFAVVLGLSLLPTEAVYFTMTDVKMKVPYLRNSIEGDSGPLLTFYALNDNRFTDHMNFRYSLNTTGANLLKINPTTGVITLDGKGIHANTHDLSTAATVTDNVSRESTVFEITFQPLDKLDFCDLLIVDLCYWPSANYKIYENTKPSLIGSLSSPYLMKLCKGFKIDYMLTKGNDVLRLIPGSPKDPSWKIASRTEFDRDVFNENSTNSTFVSATVVCTVVDTQGSSRNVSRSIQVQVLDEDDNPPEAQENNLQIHLDNDKVSEGQIARHPALIFLDKDSPKVNNYDFKILHNHLKIDIKPECNIHEDDRDVLPQTAISCVLVFTKEAELRESKYNITLQVNDTSQKANRHNISIPSTATLPICLCTRHCTDETTKESQEKPLKLYPTRSLTIIKTAAPFARITQPNLGSLRGAHNFRIVMDETNGAINVTEKQGIIYVSNAIILKEYRKSTSQLKIQWTDKTNTTTESDDIEVKITEDSKSTCKGVKDWKHCARYDNKTKCVKACAISTGGATSVESRKFGNTHRCMWHGDEEPGDTSTRIFSTCTADSSTCPDHICDPLEDLDQRICPQDCSRNIIIPTETNKETNRGIARGSGICTCDDRFYCMCSPFRQRKAKKVDENDTLINLARTGSQMNTCGATCMLSIAAAGLFLLGAIAMVVACCRLEKVKKAVREKFSQDTQDLSAPLSDYVDRGVLLDNLQLNFDMTSALEHSENKCPPDPKWEFPRSQLIIEQTLGEGEFGRVLRARALNIGGQTGYTTVAVKTLKDDAREAELADLLSEYQLLKDVSHPNVIRLLGASTVPGGPVYLIIEFAQYGSLRNYLRRSRHLKSENSHLPFSDRLDDNSPDHYDEPNVAKVTPQEILSFAWQICNGMAYLTDIKLVHRDLAARNVLLAAEKVCKISDFGLTRDIYEDDAYFKKSRGRVPVKWMAPESLSDHIYTSKSDVWSFGILVWELVTLGATPYPGIAVQNLFHLIRSGYRMERPENCSPALYKVMRGCWALDPEERPTFHELVTQWEKMLGDQVEYLDLTNNAIHNRSYFCSPVEEIEEEEEIEEKEKSTTPTINYLSKSQSYVKCGETDKMLNDLQDEKEHSSATQGYETPVKIRNNNHPQTPTNECPQYYTDMAAGKSISH